MRAPDHGACVLRVHILQRGIVFVDLSLAQFIGLGIAFSFFIGEGDVSRQVFSLLFAVMGPHTVLFKTYIEGAQHKHRGPYRSPLYIFTLRKHIGTRQDASRIGRVQGHYERQHPLGWASGAYCDLRCLFRNRALSFRVQKKVFRLSFENSGGISGSFYFSQLRRCPCKSVQMAGILQVFLFL